MADPFLSRPAPPRFKPTAPRRERSHSGSTVSSAMLVPSLSSRSAFTDVSASPALPKSATSSVFEQPLSTETLLTRLESLLVAKSQEIQLAGRLGESLLTQQAELENRIRELEHDASSASETAMDRRNRSYGHAAEPSEQAVVGEDVRRKLESLESEMRQWEVENEEMYRSAGISRSATQDGGVTPDLSTIDEAPSTNGNLSRRERNQAAGNRSNDIEFAAEIGQSLLLEVRRLQVLLNERDEALREEREAKEALDREREAAQAALRVTEEGVEKYKEENWNLELQVQELRTSHADATDTATRTESERARLAKALASARESHDAARAEADRHVLALETLRAKHETDMANARKTQAGLQREKTDIQASLDAAVLAANAKNIRRSLSLGQESVAETARGTTPDAALEELAETEDEEEDDVFGRAGGIRPRGSILPTAGSPAPSIDGVVDGETPATNDVGQLRAALAHRQRTIETLRHALQREKEARIRGGRGESTATIDDGESSDVSPVAARRAVGRRGGHARRGLPGRRGGHIPSKLARQLSGGLGAEMVEEVDGFSDEDEHDYSQGDELETLDIMHDPRDGPAKGSLASLDPAFADMQNGADDSLIGSILGERVPSLRHRPSQGSMVSQRRPISGMFSSVPDLVSVALVDAGTMTEPVVLIPTVDFGVQVTPDPAPARDFALQTEVVATTTLATQTDVPPAQAMATQTEALSMVEKGIATDVPPTLAHSSSQTDTPGLIHAVSHASIATISTPRGRQAKLAALARSREADSADGHTDYMTETDGETDFEDAHESIGAPTPSFSMTPSASMRDFHSMRTVGQAGDSDEDEELSVVKTPAAKTKPVMVDVGVQTEPPAPVVAPEVNVTRRESNATFGGRISPLPGAIASTMLPAGSTYVQVMPAERALSPDASEASRPVSMVSDTSTATTMPPPAKPTVDKSKPPVLSMPPPPAMPPPIRHYTPRKPSSTTSSIHSVFQAPPPPRPSSPPPPELLQRATSPTLLMPTTARQYTAGSTPGPTSKRPRAAASTASLAPSQRGGRPSAGMTEFGSPVKIAGRNALRTSAASTSSFGSRRSRAQSIASSHTSEGDHTGGYGAPPLPGAMGDMSVNTDPAIIHAITQTMIGEFLFKYTRRKMTSGFSENRHKRFFWIHPYSKSLYWSMTDAAALGSTGQQSSKSVAIEGVRQEFDANPMPPGMHQNSLIIKTATREIKITAPTRERHEMWFSAMNYLLNRPEPVFEPASPSSRSMGTFSPGTAGRRSTIHRLSTGGAASTPPGASWPTGGGGRPSMYKHHSASESVLPSTSKGAFSPSSSRSSRFGTAGRSKPRQSAASTLHQKRSDTPAAEYLEQTANYGSPRSVRSYGGDNALFDDSLEIVNAHDISYDADETLNLDVGYEGLENVRICCGEHDVGRLSTKRRGSHSRVGHTHDARPTSPSPSVRVTKASGSTVRSSRRSIGSLWGAKHGEVELPPPVPSAR